MFLNFPLGHQVGKKFQPELQRSILKDTLNALYIIREPGMIIQLPYRWAEDDSWEQHVTLDTEDETEDEEE